MERRKFLITYATVSIGIITGCLGGNRQQQNNGGDENMGGEVSVKETSSVSMINSQFSPRNIHIDPGTTVTWTNNDDFGHTVSSGSDNWEKDTEVSGGDSTTYTFDESGVYDVYCRFHGSSDLSGMSMKIAVGNTTIQSPLGTQTQTQNTNSYGY